MATKTPMKSGNVNPKQVTPLPITAKQTITKPIAVPQVTVVGSRPNKVGISQDYRNRVDSTSRANIAADVARRKATGR